MFVCVIPQASRSGPISGGAPAGPVGDFLLRQDDGAGLKHLSILLRRPSGVPVIDSVLLLEPRDAAAGIHGQWLRTFPETVEGISPPGDVKSHCLVNGGVKRFNI